MGIPDHLTCLLRNLYADQEATVRTGHGTTDWFQIGKGVCRTIYSDSAYLTFMQSTSCETLGWMKHKLESRLLREISITSDMQWHHPYGRKWREGESFSEYINYNFTSYIWIIVITQLSFILKIWFLLKGYWMLGLLKYKGYSSVLWGLYFKSCCLLNCAYN